MSDDVDKRPVVAIVGGGISGLSTAFYLNRALGGHAERGMSKVDLPRVLLFESTGRLGGPVGTEVVDPEDADGTWLFERGPDSFLGKPPSVLHLAADLGLEEEIITPNHCDPSLYLWRDGLREMPSDMALVVPGNMAAFMQSDILSDAGKQRVLQEPSLGPDVGMPRSSPNEDGDVSMGEFFRARLGDEMVQVVVAPILAGIYSGDIDQLSLMSTFPRFVNMVREHGSLLEGARLAVEARKEAALLKTGVGEPGNAGGKNLNPFRSLRRGVGSLMEALTVALDQVDILNIKLGQKAVDLSGEPGDWELTVESNGERHVHHADEVVLATPAWASAEILTREAPTSAKSLKEVPYTSTVGVYLGFRREGFEMPGSAGVLLPRDDTFQIKGVQLGGNKYPGRAPEGHALFRVFLGGVGREEMLEKSDEELIRICRRDLAKVVGVESEPVVARVLRYRRRSPQYTVGHRERARKALEEVPETVHLVGAGYEGIGLPACVASAQLTAQKIADRLKKAKS